MKILDLDPKEDAKKKIAQYKKEIIKLEEIINKKDTLFDVVKDYTTFCKAVKIKELSVKDFKFLPEDEQVKAFNYHKIKNIEKYFNGTWVKDWNNSSQPKYYPYFNYTSQGLVFADSTYDHCDYYGRVAFFKDKQTSDFVGKTFPDIYKELSK